MSHWNYRVIRRTDTQLGEDYYAIHEVHYSRDGTIRSWSENPSYLHGDTTEELRHMLELQLSALSKPVLVEKGNTLVEVEDG